MAEPNFENRTLYHHDNLAVLLNSNSVHLIATVQQEQGLFPGGRREVSG